MNPDKTSDLIACDDLQAGRSPHPAPWIATPHATDRLSILQNSKLLLLLTRGRAERAYPDSIPAVKTAGLLSAG